MNLGTVEVVSLTDEKLRAAEDEEPIEKFPDWQQDIIEMAQEILEEDYFIQLLSKFDIHGYRIMEEFCL